MAPFVAAPPPPAWEDVEVAAPKLAETSELTQWTALRAPARDAVFLRGCVATPVPGWVEDMRPAVAGRTVALAGAAAEAITGVAMDARDEAGVLVLRAASDLAAPPRGKARTFIGFDATRVFTCVAICARPSGEDAPTHATADCEQALVRAHLEADGEPPPAGAGLRLVTWAVHHPRPTGAAIVTAAALAGVLAVATRRRPRARA